MLLFVFNFNLLSTIRMFYWDLIGYLCFVDGLCHQIFFIFVKLDYLGLFHPSAQRHHGPTDRRNGSSC